VIYAASGMYVTAALLEDPDVILEHGLYGAQVETPEEGMFLCAILNAPALTHLVRPLMSYGKDERHIDKSLWKLPIPLYDPTRDEHRRLAELGGMEAERIRALSLDPQRNFTALRRVARDALTASPHVDELDELVTAMLGF
jgi:hypothetical protein